jgi:alkylhydroperoxidase family enzyme
MGWISAGDSRATTLGVLPEMAERFDALYRALWTQHHIPAATLELCRLRLAQLHRCAVELQRSDGDIPSRQRDNLARWESDGSFSAAERACLAFTEVYAMDVQALTDELAEDVKVHFGAAGLVLLVEALGILDGMTRLSLLWQLPARNGQRDVAREST